MFGIDLSKLRRQALNPSSVIRVPEVRLPEVRLPEPALPKQVAPSVSQGIGSLPNIDLSKIGQGGVKTPTVQIPQIPNPMPFVPSPPTSPAPEPTFGMPGSGFTAPFGGGGGNRPSLVNVPTAIAPEPATTPAQDVRADEDLTTPAAPYTGIIDPETGRFTAPISAPFTGGPRVPQVEIDPETGIPQGPIQAPFTGGPRVDPVQIDPETGLPDRPITTDPRDRPITTDPRDFTQPPEAEMPEGNLDPDSNAPPSGPGGDDILFNIDNAGSPFSYTPQDVSVATNYALSSPLQVPTLRRANPFDPNSPMVPVPSVRQRETGSFERSSSIPLQNQGVGSLFVRGG